MTGPLISNDHKFKVAYTLDHPAPPHISSFFVILFYHTDCPFNTIWVPSPPPERETAQIGAPYCYLSHIPLPPANKDNIRAIPVSLALMAKNKVLLHPCFYSFLLTSIDFPATTEDHIHTVYDTQPTYNMLLPISIIMNYWYLLPFTNKASNFKYPPKDYVTWAMHFLAQGVDDNTHQSTTDAFNTLNHPLLTPYIPPPSLTSTRLTPTSSHKSFTW
jgi:hypothetical protein